MHIRLLFALFAFLSLSEALIAQNPDTLKSRVSFETFPIGALRYFGVDTLERMLGMNHGWSHGALTSSRVAAIGTPYLASSTVSNPFYFGVGSSAIEPLYLLKEAARAHDIRIYMPNTSGRTKEYHDRWDSLVGGPWTVLSQVIDTAQWQIEATESLPNSPYVFRNLSHSATAEVYYGSGHFENPFEGNHVNTYSYEFVFDINSPGSFVHPDTVLYQLEYWIKPYNSSTWSLLDSVRITYNGFLALPNAITTVAGKPSSSDSLSRWSYRQQNTRHYKNLKRVFNLRNYYGGVFTAGFPANGMMVDVRLKTFKKWPIFVRGLRIRDWRAQQLLSGAADGQLVAAAKKLLEHKTNNVPVNANMKEWVLLDEPNRWSFRAIAYVNELLSSKKNGQLIGRPLSMLLAYDYDLFQRQFRDQTRSKSGTMMFDWYPFGGSIWRAADVYQENGNLHARPRVSNWGGEGKPLLGYPLPIDVAGDSLEMHKRGVPVMQNYDQYTATWQDSLIGFGSEGIGRGDAQALLNIARSSYELDPSNPQAFTLMPQSYIKRHRRPKWHYDSLGDVLKSV